MISTTHLLSLLLLLVAQADSKSLPARLGSPDVRIRIEATEELVRRVETDASILENDEIQETTVALLETENALVADNFRTFLQTKKSGLDEVYAEHYARVLGLGDQLRKDASPKDRALLSRLRRALVMGSYNPDSAFATGLALEGAAIVPIVLEMTKATINPTKWNAFALIGELLSLQDARRLATPLSAGSQSALRSAAREGLLDPAPDVRIWAISAVVRGKDREAVPYLRLLAQTDPDTDRGATKYSVRSSAAAALEKLR